MKSILEEVNAHLAEHGLLMREGTLVDATSIAALSSTKNKSGGRDPEPEHSGDSQPDFAFEECWQMHQTRKDNQWFFGMKRTSEPPLSRGWCIA